MQYYFEVLRKYAVFQGRAARKEFWMYWLCNGIIGFLIIMISALITKTPATYTTIEQSWVYWIYALAVLTPTLAVSARRLHDIDRSAWWLLFYLIPFVGSIVLLIFFLLDSQPGTNTYGPNPKNVSMGN